VREGAGAMKTPISKIEYPVTPRKNVTKKELIVFCVIVVILMGVVIGYQYYQNRPENILPPEMHLKDQTYEQVINFIESDDTNTIPYEFGFNCVDAAFRLWRNATWNGIGAFLIAIQYTDSPGHMVIAFPTNNKGDIFIEPLSDLEIKLRVGGKYNGLTVRGIYVLSYNFTPFYGSPPYDPNIEPE
jgi:hypothetical protein